MSLRRRDLLTSEILQILVSNRFKKIATNVLKITISIILLYLVFRKIPFKNVSSIIKDVNITFLLFAAIFFLGSQILSAKRLEKFLHAQGFLLSFRSNLELYFLGMFYNFFIPGGIGGDAYKVILLKNKFGWSGKKLTSALFNDRLCGLIAIIILGGILLSFLLASQYIWICLLTSLFIVLAGYILMVVIFPTFKRIYLISLLYSLILQAMQVACFVLLVKSLGMDGNPIIYAVTFLAGSILSLVTFAGIGIREMMFLQASKFFEFNASLSVSASILFSLITIAFSFVGIFFQLRKLNLKLTDRL